VSGGSAHRTPSEPPVQSLAPGDLVPHFVVSDAAGRRVSYAESIWQRRHLVLVTVPATAEGAGAAALARFDSRRLGVDDDDVAVVVTSDPIAGVPRSGFLAADRWGEVAVVIDALSAGELPDDDEARAWVSYVRQQCPECQGEVR